MTVEFVLEVEIGLDCWVQEHPFAVFIARSLLCEVLQIGKELIKIVRFYGFLPEVAGERFSVIFRINDKISVGPLDGDVGGHCREVSSGDLIQSTLAVPGYLLRANNPDSGITFSQFFPIEITDEAFEEPVHLCFIPEKIPELVSSFPFLRKFVGVDHPTDIEQEVVVGVVAIETDPGKDGITQPDLFNIVDSSVEKDQALFEFPIQSLVLDQLPDNGLDDLVVEDVVVELIELVAGTGVAEEIPADSCVKIDLPPDSAALFLIKKVIPVQPTS